ncbi:MAG: DUF3253 domain-containing protein [Pseudomonadota bacterium]
MASDHQPPRAALRRSPPDREAIAAEILALVAARGPGKSICPSEAARALDPDDWRRLMGAVRAEAAALARSGRLTILRKGRPIDPDAMRGVVRLALPPPD